MKNLKKVIFALMVVFLVVGFIGCKTETDPKDPPASDPAGTGGNDQTVNNFIGKWTMDELFVTCEITETGFKTITDIDEDGNDDEINGTYTLSNDKRTAVATFTLGAEPLTVEIALLDGETDVATMDLSAFPGMGTSTFVKHREGDVDITGTWTDGNYNINITAEEYSVAPVSAPENVVSTGTVSKTDNSFTLTDSETSFEIATAVVSVNRKAYCCYYDGMTDEWVSAAFTKSN